MRKRTALALLASASSVGLAGCGLTPSAATVPTRHSTAQQRTAGPSAADHGTGMMAVEWFHLPLRTTLGTPTLIATISPETRGLVLQVASYRRTQTVGQPANHTLWWKIGSQSVSPWAASVRTMPGSPSAFQLVSASPTTATPQLLKGNVPAAIHWPAQIPVYQSGQNPGVNPFQLDNRVIGQSGAWIWVALKGPAHAGGGLPAGVWGFRHWDRLVALNTATGQYRIFALPRTNSETLAYPLWSQPPAFAAASHRVYIGAGSWMGIFPANPWTAGAAADQGGPASTLTAARVQRALNVLNQAAWQSVDADAEFWNCYVMKDPSPNACPAGGGFPSQGALSYSPTYFNHGDVGFPILWASQLPMPGADAQSRAAAMKRLKQGLGASLMMAWIANPRAGAIRQKYAAGPPYALPGYYRKNGLYWAKTSPTTGPTG